VLAAAILFGEVTSNEHDNDDTGWTLDNIADRRHESGALGGLQEHEGR
jgi:hypothetical protein